MGAGVVVTRDEDDTAKVTLGRTAAEVGAATSATERSLTDFWTRQLPEAYGKQFTPLRGGFQPKDPTSPPFTCGGKQQTYDDLKGNAFYCGSGDDDYIAFDAAMLFPQLNNEFGGIAPAVVLAHEMGHAIQRRGGVQAASVVMELQADCFAGSWVRYAETSADDPVDLSDGALDSAISTVLTLRDQPGTSATNAQAHGLGFDRVNSFQSGYEQGARDCAALPERGPVTTELPFRTVSELQTGGNLSFTDAVDVLPGQLDAFWQKAMPQVAGGTKFVRPARRPVDQPPTESDCVLDAVAGYCKTLNAVVWTVPALRQAHQRIGDLATGTLLSDAWGLAVQSQAGLPASGRQAGLQRDCFTGAWISALAAGGLEQSLLSPGDIDEALVTIVASSFDPAGGRLDRGGAFERTEWLRKGLFQGIGSCDA
jgi:predicted metalloprotease